MYILMKIHIFCISRFFRVLGSGLQFFGFGSGLSYFLGLGRVWVSKKPSGRVGFSGFRVPDPSLLFWNLPWIIDNFIHHFIWNCLTSSIYFSWKDRWNILQGQSWSWYFFERNNVHCKTFFHRYIFSKIEQVPHDKSKYDVIHTYMVVFVVVSSSFRTLGYRS